MQCRFPVLISRYEDPYELGMCLRWGLARVGRTKNGQAVKGVGLLDWDRYMRDKDLRLRYVYVPRHEKGQEGDELQKRMT
jgi:hypothetical protein